MAKILNVDELAQEEARELVIKGVTYTVKSMDVDDFIEISTISAKLSESDMSVAEQMNASIKLIKRGIPEINESILRALKLPQLAAVAQFVRGVDPEIIMGANKIEHEQAQGEQGAESAEGKAEPALA